MTLTSYSDAMHPEGREVFGVRLPPLCIGHALILHRLRSPLVCREEGTRLPGAGDLLLALELCRHTPPRLPSLARLKRLGLCQLRFTARQKLRLEARHLDGIRDFRAWWNDAFTRPGVWRGDDDGEPRDSGVPELVALKLRLMAWLHCSEAEALATPVARALWDLSAYSALEGKVRLHTAEEEALLAAARAGGGTKITLSEPETPNSEPGTDTLALALRTAQAAQFSTLNSQPA